MPGHDKLMAQPGDYGAHYLQQRIDREIALAKPMGIIVEAADGERVVLRAPLAPNSNHKGTAFGGSLYALAVLAVWAWASGDLAARQLDADAVIQESSMRFLTPVHGELRASVEVPAADAVDKFHRMLARAGRGRIQLRVDLYHGKILAAVFDGLFAAATRR